ncbi:MAG: squalene--hopene cyclase [Candidatus Rokubacteria bacterium 13_1_40CM_69_27]|nr:MAG: squalene--hopene cyclase [Candidatus Rokubacteria bacterium 13_1_40CM_69_27]
MLPSAIVTGLSEAISRAQVHLLSRQAADGYWVGELEADTTITSEYLLLCHLIDRVNRERELKAVRYLRSRQLPDGGFNLFEGGPTNLSATIKAYFAMKMASVAVDDPAMVRARERIRAMGGPARANVFTKIQLALFGEYDWNGVPAMPVEIMLLPPPFFLFNIYEVSYWSRTVIVPLLIIMDRKPVKWLPPHLSLDELWPVPREQTSLRFPRLPEPFSWRALFWKNFFIAVDDGLKIWERFSPRPLRKRAVEAARLWLEERLAVPGGLGGIYPAMAYAVVALRLLGYPDDHPLIRGQLKEIEALAREDADQIHYQPCLSPVWDTALAINALIESDLEPDHPALRRAGEWLLDGQVLVSGDWQVKRPYVQPGGWVFQYANDYYPDLDDTAMVLMALEKLRGLDPDRVQSAQERGLGWLLGMQATDGGWASFDTDQKRLYLNNIPFADHGALLDPSTEDLTGRGLELLGTCGYRADFEPARRGLQFLRHTQRHDGPWFGRWGVNYVYGTWSVLRGLRAIGEDPQQEYVQRAVRWLERHQNPDGGWGETCESYDRPELAGKGDSIPSQTAWALLGLLAAGSTNRRVIDAGIGYLLQTQRADGSWEDSRWNGTGFPRVFMLKYHLYAAYFPLWALGVYRRTLDG